MKCPVLWESPELNIIMSMEDVIIMFNTGFRILCLEIIGVYQLPHRGIVPHCLYPLQGIYTGASKGEIVGANTLVQWSALIFSLYLSA